ncbi:hypothetical protein ACW5R3_07175 [Bizionia sp. KMM 8389]
MKVKINNNLASFVIASLLCLFSSENTFAQNNIQQIFDNSSPSSTSRSAVITPDNLLHGNNPTIYVENSRVINVTGDTSPKVLKLLDGNSNSILLESNNQYRTVEIITITINQLSDLNNRIDLNALNSFPSLRYVYVKSKFDCTDQQIQNFITNSSSVTTVFYKVLSQS